VPGLMQVDGEQASGNPGTVDEKFHGSSSFIRACLITIGPPASYRNMRCPRLPWRMFRDL
jgi:hypothetical protein